MSDLVVDLDQELWAALGNLTDLERRILKHLKIPEKALHLGLVGAAHINLCEGGFYEPGDTSRAFITPVRVDDPFTPEFVDIDPALWGSLTDLIAWHPDAPEMYAVRVGFADWVGSTAPGHWHVRPSVLSWLQHQCVGVVALGEWPERQKLLRRAERVFAEDLDHAMELRRLMERSSYVPDVRIQQ